MALVSYRHFVVVFKELPIKRSDVKAGTNSLEVITACRCVNVGLFLSNAMRRDTDVTIAIMENPVQLITFSGKDLKRVSPDERSISFFILKAIEALHELPLETMRKLDNGIKIQRVSPDSFIEKWDTSTLFIAEENEESIQIESIDTLTGTFIYEIEPDLLNALILNFDLNRIERPSSPEKFILNINYYLDLNM